MRRLICTFAAAAVLLPFLQGGSCPPGIDLNAEENTPIAPQQLAVVLLLPDASRTVAQGEFVRVRWTTAKLVSGDAIVTVLVRSRLDDQETILFGGVRVDTIGSTKDIFWDTSTFAGAYDVVVRIESGSMRDDFTGTSVITVNTPPRLTFTAPSTPATIAVGGDTPPSLRIAWLGVDPDGSGRAAIGIDPDEDHSTGNEITIAERDLQTTETLQSFDWNGTRSGGGGDVDPGTYFLFATLTDGVNTSRLAEGLVQITVEEAEKTEATMLAVTEPAEDTTFLTTDSPITIEFTFPDSQEDEVLIDLKIDTDDNHQNGNEQTILSQRLIDADTTEDSFAWNGTDSGNSPVAEGIYRVVMTVSSGSGTPNVVQSDGLIFFRSTAETPLIALLAPASNTTLAAGQFLSIRWRDDDPSETATIRITLDDDGMPAEGTETDDAEIEILTGRAASGDGVQDTFSFQIPGTLGAGTYFIFAYIDRDGSAPFEHNSVAAGRLIIE